jgi:hypothetical protein
MGITHTHTHTHTHIYIYQAQNARKSSQCFRISNSGKAETLGRYYPKTTVRLSKILASKMYTDQSLTDAQFLIHQAVVSVTAQVPRSSEIEISELSSLVCPRLSAFPCTAITYHHPNICECNIICRVDTVL